MNNILFRTLLAAYAFFLTVLSFAGILVVSGAIPVRIAFEFANAFLLSGAYKILILIIMLIFFVLSVVFLLSGIIQNPKARSVIRSTDLGEIMISLNTIENIALAAGRKINGIKDIKSSVRNFDSGVSIRMQITVMPDINIPALSDELQKSVKSSVENATGISVSKVLVSVENISAVYRPRVE